MIPSTDNPKSSHVHTTITSQFKSPLSLVNLHKVLTLHSVLYGQSYVLINNNYRKYNNESNDNKIYIICIKCGEPVGVERDNGFSGFLSYGFISNIPAATINNNMNL